MIFLSRMIHDPRRARKMPGNLYGNTVGLVFYTPKFTDCRRTDWDRETYGFAPDVRMSDEFIAEMRAAGAWHQEHCRRWHWHLSYRGYAYWLGPKRRYQLHYMGDPYPSNGSPAWGYVREHGRYVRWWEGRRARQAREAHSAEQRRRIEEMGVRLR